MPEAARWRLRPAAAAAAALPRDLAGELMQGPRRGEEGRGGAGRRELRGGKGRRGRSSGGTAAAATQPRRRERERERERGEWAAAFCPPSRRETRPSSGSPHGWRRRYGRGPGGVGLGGVTAFVEWRC